MTQQYDKRRFRTTQDIVIPAGTVLDAPPTRSTRWGSDREAPIALGKDHTGYLTIDADEAVASGFAEELP